MSALRSCVEQFYLEVFPVDGIEDQLLGLSDGAYIGITCSPRRGLDETLDLVDRLHGHDFHLVPHIAARQVRDSAHLRDIVQRLNGQGVRALFIPGGDIARPVGEFSSSLLLLRELATIGHQFEHIGVAAYPEGHPAISNEILLEALRSKQELATYMVTQMCFDPAVLLGWLKAMRSRGITLPAWLGLPGVMNRMKLLQTSLRIGVGESARFARKQSSLAGRLLRSANYSPDDLVAGLAPGMEDADLGIHGFYLFSFNQVKATVAWREDLLRRLA
ncbi:MAG: methylenetetrahydrofolate reductase [Gammaproteobacteria bacterium]|nr:methylenetetrahydrofolate reductase [Gammaproteobacteria bacterium]MDH5172964.1 methylenetetrahydrofolate reductase [Gammaproteobacteria bacterium]